MLPATRPEACACRSGSYALQGVKQPKVPTRDAATRWRRDGGKTVLPDGSMLEGGQPIRLDTQRDHQPTRPHRHSHSPSNLKVRPPAGCLRLIRTAFQGHPAVCMYDVAGAAVRPRGRRRLNEVAPGEQRSAK